MIRNYRLHSISNDQDLTDEDKALLGLGRGTTLYVSNSLI